MARGTANEERGEEPEEDGSRASVRGDGDPARADHQRDQEKCQVAKAELAAEVWLRLPFRHLGGGGALGYRTIGLTRGPFRVIL